MPHNLLLTAPDAAEEVGALADAMAAEPSAMARHYVPASPRILHATPLVEPGQRAELVFTAPPTPGRYPYLCTFPGHWRMMSGVLIVECPPDVASPASLCSAPHSWPHSSPAAALWCVPPPRTICPPLGGRR